MSELTEDSGSELFEALRAGFEQGNAAFNAGDYEAAFAALPEDIEWHVPPSAPRADRVLRGREQVLEWFREMREVMAEWSAELLGVQQVSDEVLLLRFLNRGVGRGSGVPTEIEVSQVWELRDGLPRRIREFDERAEAERAAREAVAS